MTAPRPDLAVVELRQLSEELRKGDMIPVQYEIWANCLAERAAHAIPDGWKLVPCTTDENMRAAMVEVSHRHTWYSEEMWQAALAAAPQPKGPDDE